MDENDPDTEEKAPETAPDVPAPEDRAPDAPPAAPPEPSPPPALDAMQVRALREADRVHFHHRTRKENGLGHIIAVKELERPTPWESERTVEIDVESEIESFSGWTYRPPREYGYAYCTVYHYRHSDSPWATIASLLRPGDVLALRWRPDAHTNDYIKRAGLHADSVNLIVKRGEKRLVFELDASVCEDNSARMVRARMW